MEQSARSVHADDGGFPTLPGVDVSFRRGPRGKLTYARDPITGDILLDEKATYAVLTTLAARRDQYYFADSENFGTRFAEIKSDARATSSRLISAVNDAFSQVRADGLIFTGSGVAVRARTGRWRVSLTWQSPDGPQTDSGV